MNFWILPSAREITRTDWPYNPRMRLSVINPGLQRIRLPAEIVRRVRATGLATRSLWVATVRATGPFRAGRVEGVHTLRTSITGQGRRGAKPGWPPRARVGY